MGSDNHCITTSNNKEPRGCVGWTIKNIDNDESKQQIGFNHIIHNKHPLKILSCSENGQLSVSNIKESDSCSLWKIIQQKDSVFYEFISFYGLWLTMDSNGCIKMLSKYELNNDDKQHWNLQYISKQEMLRKVPISEQKNEEIIKKILKRKKSISETMHIAQIEDNGYYADDQKRDNIKSKKMKHKNKEMNELMTQFEQLSNSVNSIRSDINLLKIEMKKMQQTQQTNQQRIENKLDELLK